ncbi:uncharacterized protein K452DRAFT_354493 [Aplosporella prunicola CBS 121167]|uniref:DUF7580 domain-containing protein n=1 Tax=Aplosporella prunicola CBS 121167 TaxID=1176127 RepID=A0A6A6BSC3_9PEZI|nr:uncharacterized protein K452DRAFT_354493 [Aplosporella prunicola CBS 121167]KAF2147002.1 hypothetical protein K452DRAFT_354493 [Aplosporella prunicola CBS 121167]
MIDPASIAGLTLAICDALLKLGERTAQLVQDAKTFSEDSDRLQTKLLNENARTRSLRHVLFERSPVYGGMTLFQRFNEDSQEEIHVSLETLVHTLKEACILLEKHTRGLATPPSERMEVSENSSPTTYTSELSVRGLEPALRSPSPGSSWKTFPKASMLLLRWSFHDKKRTEEILRNFAGLNGDIHEKIKLLCLASDLGLPPQNNIEHLKRLQNDASAIGLGFDIDARLRLTARNDQSVSDKPSLELDSSWSEVLTSTRSPDERLLMIERNGQNFLLEYRAVETTQGLGHTLDARTKTLIEELARILHEPKELAFCMLHCLGWKRIPGSQRVGLIFEIPGGVVPKPTNLFHMLGSRVFLPELGERYKLAFALARCISQLQLVKWVHESFRSENILFFPRQNESSTQESFDLSKPVVLGYEFSRPELDFSSGFTDICIERDVYRHPERQGRPGKMFNKIHDIYALGVVLLEIGLWERAINLERNNFRTARDPWVIKEQLLKQAKRRLGDKMGVRYRDVVVKCLTADFEVVNDTKDDLKLQQAFRVQVVNVLEAGANFL